MTQKRTNPEHQYQRHVVRKLRDKGYIVHADQNQGKRSIRQQQMLRESGVMPGWPDVSIPLDQGRMLLIEMKADSYLSDAQKELHAKLKQYGHLVYTVKAKDKHDAWQQVQDILASIPHTVIKFSPEIPDF